MTIRGAGLLAAAGLLAGSVLGGVASSGAERPPLRARVATAVAAEGDTVGPGDPFQRPPVAMLRARRSALLDSVAPAMAVIPSAGARDGEAGYPQASDFRQSADFFYLTGLESPDSWLVLMDDGRRRRELLFVPEPDSRRARWTGAGATLEEAAEITGVEDVRPADEFREAVETGRFSGAGGVLYLPFRRQNRGDPLMERLAYGIGEGSASGAPAVRDLKPVLDGLRLVKDTFEIRMLRRAVAVTTAALEEALREAEPGMYEYELEARVEYGFHRRGAERVGFPSIVGSGPNSVILHYDENRRRTEAGDVVVMDVGAEYSYYTADVTRTVPVSGRFTGRQRRVYELVLGAQDAALEAVRPGATMVDLSRAARRYLRRNSGDACGGGSCADHFIHGVGHWLGLDVHDVGSYGSRFRPGMVLTVEPGIYLPEEDLGVRIEDDVLVTEDGHEVLSRSLPRGPDEIERLMAGGG